MDTYSPEDAAGDLQLEVAEQRPAHDLHTPGAWRWLAPLGLCVTFAGAVVISIVARPEPATIQGGDAPTPVWAPHHYEPPVDAAPAPAAAVPVSAESAAAALVPSLRAPELPAEPPAATDAAPAREKVSFAAVAPARPATAPSPAPQPSPSASSAPAPEAGDEGDLPSVEIEDEDEDEDAHADEDDDADGSQDAAPVVDDEDLDAVSEPALPGAGA